MKKILGILGGMGPAATADLYAKIVAMTEASSDREHIRTIIDSNVNIPDRTAAILMGGENPLEEMEAALDNLVCAGAEVIIIPCNTAHYFLPALKEYAEENYDMGDALTFISMIEETAKACAKRNPQRAAILATKGTLESGLYQKALNAQGVDYIVPDDAGKDVLMQVIYQGVKAGADPCTYILEFKNLLDRLAGQGADYFMLACTELPIAFAQLMEAEAMSGVEVSGTNEESEAAESNSEARHSTIDPTEELAKSAITACGYELKHT